MRQQQPMSPTDTQKPAYRLDRPSGRFLPANDAAWRECAAWNAYAHATMARLGTLPLAATAHVIGADNYLPA